MTGQPLGERPLNMPRIDRQALKALEVLAEDHP